MTFTHRVIAIQTWNNDNRQLLSEHKSLSAAQKMVKASERKKCGNRYVIETI